MSPWLPDAVRRSPLHLARIWHGPCPVGSTCSTREVASSQMPAPCWHLAARHPRCHMRESPHLNRHTELSVVPWRGGSSVLISSWRKVLPAGSGGGAPGMRFSLRPTLRPSNHLSVT